RPTHGSCRILAWPAAVAACACLGAAPAGAQTLERFTADSVVSLDEFGGENASHRPQVVIDISAAVRLGDNWQLFLRPWFRQARPSTPTAAVPKWDTEIYQAGARYERAGAISTRVDLGYLVSPVGLGLFDARANLNPTIVPHLGYVVPMPVFDPAVPREMPIASTYPFGAELTASTMRWDARAAVVNSAPTRVFAAGNDVNPKATPVVEGGAGVTPVVGLRLGVSFAHGQYATGSELTRPAADGRTMTMIGGEGEYAFRYTKLAAEFVTTAFATSADTARAYEWFVQGTQTLSPRWFVAARREGVSAPPLATGIVAGARSIFGVFEATAGFRLNPEITLRSSYYSRRSYTSSTWDNQVGVSIVWARRWR
ncbi:MAG: hypothetical protein ACHQO8_12475, partial [Vicinamibacterales bacterium]